MSARFLKILAVLPTSNSSSSIERLHGTFWREEVLPSVETKLSWEDNLEIKDLEPKSLVNRQCSASQPCKFIIMSYAVFALVFLNLVITFHEVLTLPLAIKTHIQRLGKGLCIIYVNWVSNLWKKIIFPVSTKKLQRYISHCKI